MPTKNLKTKVKKHVKKNAKKQVKKNPVALILMAVFLIGGAAGGYFGGKYLTRNDCFEVVGEKQVQLTIGDDYVDEGAKAISFGKDISTKIKIEIDPSFDNTVAGEYYVKYTVDNIRYKNVVRYRYVVVSEVASEE